jgi:hypothetical protein
MTVIRSAVLTGLLCGASALAVLQPVHGHSATLFTDGSRTSIAANESAPPRGPARVRTWLYYGLNDVNAGVPPEVMARYADFVEDDGYAAAHAMRFKAAGGRYAAAYTDPAYVPYCAPPFAPPAGRCKGPIGDVITDESAFFHGRDGTRVRRFVDPHFQYQEAINPLSPAARRAWRDTTAALVRKAPSLDLFFADDSGGPLRAGDMSPTSSEFYGFNEAGTEITSDTVFRDAWIAYLTSAVRPVVINGNDPVTGEPAYDGAFLRAPRVWGAVHEGCFRGGGGLQTDRNDRWRSYADSLLSNTALHKLAICFMMGTPTPQTRVYALASWWLTYDPEWSVAGPIDAIPDQSALLPEIELVPGGPLRTARRIRELRDPSGAYVREFRGCFQRGEPIGGCAALVNPSAREVPVPPVAARYSRALVLGNDDLPHGGRAAWAAPPPRSIAPGSAVILAR